MAKYANVKRWFTTNGNHIPVLEGETGRQAMMRFLSYVRRNNNIDKPAKTYEGEMVGEGKDRHFESKDGSTIEYLSNKEYDKICKDFNDNLTDEERETLLKYVDSPFMAASSELNKLTDDDIDKIESPKDVSDGYVWGTKVAWNKNPDSLESMKEHEDRVDIELAKAKEQGISGYALDSYARSKGFAPAEFGDDDYKGSAARKSHREWAQEDPEFAKKYNEKSMIKNIDYENDNTTKNIEFISRREALRRVNSEEFKIQAKETKKDLTRMAEQQKQIDTIFENKGIVLEKDMVVYRRTRENEKQIKEGFTKYGYTSTTQKSNISKKMPSGNAFGDHEIEIIIPAGTKVLPLKGVIENRMRKETDEYSIKANKQVMKQNEILLPRETSFNYVSTYIGEYLGYGKGNETKYTVVADTSMQKHNYKYKSRKKIDGKWVYEY